jgi:hypothetical protein
LQAFGNLLEVRIEVFHVGEPGRFQSFLIQARLVRMLISEMSKSVHTSKSTFLPVALEFFNSVKATISSSCLTSYKENNSHQYRPKASCPTGKHTFSNLCLAA